MTAYVIGFIAGAVVASIGWGTFILLMAAWASKDVVND